MVGWGLTFNGFICYHWFRFLDRLFPPHKNTLPRVLLKITVNQLVLAPTANGAFFAFAVARRHDLWDPEARRRMWHELFAKFRSDLLRLCVQSTCFWGPAHIINFLYVPPPLRILYVSVSFFVWTVWLSIIGHRRVANTPSTRRVEEQVGTG